MKDHEEKPEEIEVEKTEKDKKEKKDKGGEISTFDEPIAHPPKPPKP